MEKTLGQVAQDAFHNLDSGPQYWDNLAATLIAEYERRKAARQAGWTLGKVAYEVHRLEPWEGVSEFGKERYEAMAQAVAEEVERRKAAAEPPTEEEAATWRSGLTVQAIKAYRARRKCTLKESYMVLSSLPAAPQEPA